MNVDSTYAGQYPYKSSNGYTSEPERNYDSDYSIKYKTLDRRRNPSTGSSTYEQYVFSTWFLSICVSCMARRTKPDFRSYHRLTTRNALHTSSGGLAGMNYSLVLCMVCTFLKFLCANVRHFGMAFHAMQKV